MKHLRDDLVGIMVLAHNNDYFKRQTNYYRYSSLRNLLQTFRTIERFFFEKKSPSNFLKNFKYILSLAFLAFNNNTHIAELINSGANEFIFVYFVKFF